MSKTEKVGVLTSGGDSAGINAAIRAIGKFLQKRGIKLIGLKNGWAGLLTEDKNELLTESKMSGIISEGGSIIGSSRTKPHKNKKRIQKAVENYENIGFSGLIAIGGDDTMEAALALSKEGINIIGIPQTIDNDVAKTDYCIGFDTALNIVKEACSDLHTTASTHHRVLVLETMGREAGWLGLFGGLAGGADIIIIPERKTEIKWVIDRIQEREKKGKDFSIVAISEGAKFKKLGGRYTREAIDDEYRDEKVGGVGNWFIHQIKDQIEMPIRPQILGYLQRSGTPTGEDSIRATKCGIKACEFYMENNFGVMTAIKGQNIKPVSLEKVVAKSPKTTEEEMLLNYKDLFY